MTVEEAVSMVSLIEELEAREAAARVRVEELESHIAELTVRLEVERETWSRLAPHGAAQRPEHLPYGEVPLGIVGQHLGHRGPQFSGPCLPGGS
ncbi:hypothetical protein ITI46_05125 [Streptomyces oryzae]|uniref:Uncharacterized protein n=1 Tax=Streptomyces oryzae TaxID=1434886 RepID=A0ABS3X6X5_9ACTN|nr:hypothetical protein [Streptomyces oryzae]MBO8191079.1 hypothetical protein [Streptomyces oryzae]